MTATALKKTSPLAPFRHPAFAMIWTATVVSNVGTWLQNAAAGWLMTGLSPSPLLVAMVQAATTLPMFLLALPGGALSDIVDRRRFLILFEIASTVVIAGLGLFVFFDWITPVSLLIFTFLIAAIAATVTPAWQSIVPDLVPRSDLPAAIALNSAGLNISRAVGPALAGILIGAFGLAAPFWINAASNVSVVAGLAWWRPPKSDAITLPAERFWSAIAVGLRYARYDTRSRATLIRAAGFFPFASAYWALLPLVAREQLGGGPGLYGSLLGVIGASAVVGALFLPWLKEKLGVERLIVAATAGTAAALALFAIARNPATAVAAAALAGGSWIAVIATLNVSAQLSLPRWVRGRGLAVFGMVVFGGMAVGSIVWGQVAAMAGLPIAHAAAAVALLAALPFLMKCKLESDAAADLAPAMSWPLPAIIGEIAHDQGPVMVTIEYRVARANRDAFLSMMFELAKERRRDGSYNWNIVEDVEDPEHFVEVFFSPSWLDHLRHHERVTKTDQDLQLRAVAFHIGPEPPLTKHFITSGRE